MFSCEQKIGPLQNGSKLFEDEGIERIGSDIALRATPMLTAGAHWIVIMTGVIASIVPLAPGHSMTADSDPAVAALEHVSQQPCLIVDPARTPPRVVTAHVLGRLEQLITHDAGHVDSNPLLGRT